MSRLQQLFMTAPDVHAVPVVEIQHQLRSSFGAEITDTEVALVIQTAFPNSTRKRRMGRYCYTGLKPIVHHNRPTLLELAETTTQPESIEQATSAQPVHQSQEPVQHTHSRMTFCQSQLINPPALYPSTQQMPCALPSHQTPFTAKSVTPYQPSHINVNLGPPIPTHSTTVQQGWFIHRAFLNYHLKI